MITIDTLSKIFPKTPQNILLKYVDHINYFCDANQINTKLRISHFLSQVGHESGELMFSAENLNYSAQGLLKTFRKYFDDISARSYQKKPEMIANKVYANRMGNGSEQSGDGWKFRGKGLIQITGRTNVTSFANDIKKSVEDTIKYLDTPRGCVHSATWYWNKNNLNKLADANDIRGLTKAINGGSNGLEDRKRLFDLIFKTL